MAKKDLFDDTTMTFGEHLEALRVHLWKAIVGLVIGSVAAFTFSNYIIVAIQRPVVAAMDKKFAHPGQSEEEVGSWENVKKSFVETFGLGGAAGAGTSSEPADPAMFLSIDAREIAKHLHEMAPDSYAAPPEDGEPVMISVPLAQTEFGKLVTSMRKESLIPRTDGPDEAFMIYMKVSLIVGVIISSPWILYQLWLFIGAGLYSHERSYVYRYLPMSVALFLGGALFCFFLVIPLVLNFLFGFNTWLGLRPEMKISTWITFALMVSVMFGVSFQLPLVMLFLERISLVSSKLYRDKRRHAILIIAFVSMVLTPSDPVSMMMMMIPLCILYELGIILCNRRVEKKSPFEALPA